MKAENKSKHQHEHEHNYVVLDDYIDVEELKYFDREGTELQVSGYAIFYCIHCLDIKKKVF